MPDFPLFPDAASTASTQVDALYLVWVLISLFFAALIAATILVFFMKYKRLSDSERGSEDHFRTLPVEITWSVIPLVIALAMFLWGAKVFFFVSRPPADAVEYFVTGKQWMWKVQHPEGVREINTLHLPVGQAVKLTMTSEDVIHSFFVPAFRVKQDVLPGRYSTVWFEPTRPGVYHLFCAEYCGAEHSLMGGSVVVLEPEAYEQWLAGASGGTSMLASGAELYQRFSCATCHREGDGPATRGPSLAGLYGKTVELAGGGRAVADADYIRESIVDPQARVTAGWQPIMPTYRGQVTEEQLNALVAYVRSLDGGTGTERAEPGGPAPAHPTATDTAEQGTDR
jgi:cytochrome c oxidase subunit 2